MGAISSDELIKLEKMHLVSAREEKILVLVRLRPLSGKEITANEVADWECINETTILYRNSLREGSTFPSAYTFDRVFRGDCSTKQLYDEGAKEIVLSAVNGINSSIFAYGQTSSGKTYTMMGITEYTVSDIFEYINKHEERAFVLKFSAIEIYNESVRDLLSTDSTPLRLLDDPEKGTIVEKVMEEPLRDWNHLKELLSICEAQRHIGETLLNEKSSRSHQILKLTVESSAREFLGRENSTTLSASVNFVDLAGSERASQALSAGARLKEGCHINRSLLTLGTVIRKLSKGKHGHINYRDSKLTRLLQPALGGNARTAVVCTLSPARSHVEQTRNTLLFACCAKEVTTKAQVNVVMSDKALVKHLQQELARLESELRTPVPASSGCDHVALLRKKDLQIQKMERDMKELSKQRDLAQSRVEDLLRMIRNDEETPRKSDEASHNSYSQHLGDTWEDECSVSASSGVVDAHSTNIDIKKLNTTQYSNGKIENFLEKSYHHLQNSGENGFSDVTTLNTQDEGTSDLADTFNGDTRKTQTIGDGGLMNHMPNCFDEPEPMGSDLLSSRSLNLKRSWSCRANLMSTPSSPWHEMAEQVESTPPNSMEKNFSGRPERLRWKIPPFNYNANIAATLTRSDSQSSLGSLSSDVSSIKGLAGEDITSIKTFVEGLNMAKHQYEKQVMDGPVHEMGSADRIEKNVKDVGLEPMQEMPKSSQDSAFEFERQQKAILELWQTCNVSLVHRTYFLLLFKGDPADSIYLEVELRRLSFLKENFSHRTNTMQNSLSITLGSSLKSLRRERHVLSKLMHKRFSEVERKRLYQKWGIGLNSKRRRLQLANCLWSSTNDMNHIMESASIVAKLVRFAEQGQALKEMFGLSFTPQHSKRRPFGWKHSKALF